MSVAPDSRELRDLKSYFFIPISHHEKYPDYTKGSQGRKKNLYISDIHSHLPRQTPSSLDARRGAEERGEGTQLRVVLGRTNRVDDASPPFFLRLLSVIIVTLDSYPGKRCGSCMWIGAREIPIPATYLQLCFIRTLIRYFEHRNTDDSGTKLFVEHLYLW